MVPNEKRTSFADLRLFRARKPAWKIGIRNEDGFSITDLERTLIDALTHQRQLGGNVAMAALRQALKSRQTSTGKLLEMAKTLAVLDRVKNYLQVLS